MSVKLPTLTAEEQKALLWDGKGDPTKVKADPKAARAIVKKHAEKAAQKAVDDLLAERRRKYAEAMAKHWSTIATGRAADENLGDETPPLDMVASSSTKG